MITDNKACLPLHPLLCDVRCPQQVKDAGAHSSVEKSTTIDANRHYISFIKSRCFFSHIALILHTSYLISPFGSCTWRCSSSRPLSEREIPDRTMEKACSLIFIYPAFSLDALFKNYCYWMATAQLHYYYVINIH